MLTKAQLSIELSSRRHRLAIVLSAIFLTFLSASGFSQPPVSPTTAVSAATIVTVEVRNRAATKAARDAQILFEEPQGKPLELVDWKAMPPGDAQEVGIACPIAGNSSRLTCRIGRLEPGQTVVFRFKTSSSEPLFAVEQSGQLAMNVSDAYPRAVQDILLNERVRSELTFHALRALTHVHLMPFCPDRLTSTHRPTSGSHSENAGWFAGVARDQPPSPDILEPCDSVDTRRIEALSPNSRNALDLSILQPAVVSATPDGQGTGNFAIAGARADSVTFLLNSGFHQRSRRVPRPDEHVERTDEPPVVETERGSEDLIDRRYIEDLPIDRRDYLTFTLLLPGAPANRGTRADRSKTTGGNQGSASLPPALKVDVQDAGGVGLAVRSYISATLQAQGTYLPNERKWVVLSELRVTPRDPSNIHAAAIVSQIDKTLTENGWELLFSADRVRCYRHKAEQPQFPAHWFKSDVVMLPLVPVALPLDSSSFAELTAPPEHVGKTFPPTTRQEARVAVKSPNGSVMPTDIVTRHISLTPDFSANDKAYVAFETRSILGRFMKLFLLWTVIILCAKQTIIVLVDAVLVWAGIHIFKIVRKPKRQIGFL